MKAIVIGSGISGLSAGYLLKKNGFDVTVLEKSNTIGGKIKTLKENGFLIEAGPNGFLENSTTMKFIQDSGFESDLIKANQVSNRKFIFNGSLYEIPTKQQKLFIDNFLSLKARLRVFKEPFIKPSASDETVADFVTRRLGKEFLDKLIGPMSLGIYAANPYTMSIQSNFKRIKEIELNYGSLIKGLITLMREKKASTASASGSFSKTLYSFKNGMQSFIEHLSSFVDIKRNTRVISIEKNKNYLIHTCHGEYKADIVIVAAEAFEVSKIIEQIDKSLSLSLQSIPYSPIVLNAFGFESKFKNEIVNSYGYLFDLNRIVYTIGVLFDSSIFENRAKDKNFLVRIFLGGALRPDIITKSNELIIQSAIKELQRSAKIFAPFNFNRVIRYQNAIPQYLLNHKKILKQIEVFEATHPNFYFTGNAFFGVGFNDCINSSYNILNKL